LLEILLWILVAIAGLILMDQLLLWVEKKGWIYYRKTRSKSSAAGGAMMGGNVFDPGVRHLEEAVEQHIIEDEDDGDDDGKRKAKDRLT
jgi:hypothetical protein